MVSAVCLLAGRCPGLVFWPTPTNMEMAPLRFCRYDNWTAAMGRQNLGYSKIWLTPGLPIPGRFS